MPTRPNILLVFTDQQSLRAMSCAIDPGQRPWLCTPAMDAIAASGTRFLNAYCPSPVCGPSRAAMMTGRMPHQVGVDVNDDYFSPEQITMGDLLRNAGYQTAYAGKWHLSKDAKFSALPNDHRFDFLPFTLPPGATASRGSITDAPTTDSAIEFLQQQSPSQPNPFLLVVSLVNPHDICYDIRDIKPLPEGQGPPLPQNFPRDPVEPEFITQCRNRPYYGAEGAKTQGWSLDHWRGYLHTYYKRVEEIDLQIARITAALEAQGLADNTLIVFTSDHGEGMAAHQWVVKLMLFDEPATVPLIFKLPGKIASNVTTPHLASGIDLLPTFCDYADIQIPANITGKSLKPILDNPALPGQPYIVTELQPDPKDRDKRARMLRTQTHKYIAFSHGKNPELLFNLTSDPGELTNLASDESTKPILLHHRQLLSQWAAQTQDSFTLPPM